MIVQKTCSVIPPDQLIKRHEKETDHFAEYTARTKTKRPHASYSTAKPIDRIDITGDKRKNDCFYDTAPTQRQA